MMRSLEQVNQAIIACQKCPRLLNHAALVARNKRAAYQAEEYWGKPVPGWGDPQAWLWIIGLAPGAHGANRTGRMFTGDRSGDFLYAALHRAGFANQSTSKSRQDGLALKGAYISVAGRCAPPLNKLLPEELEACRPFLRFELGLLPQLKAILALGKIAYDTVWKLLADEGYPLPEIKPKFTHGTAYQAGSLAVMASYHVSQQNTFTGKLTPAMFDAVLDSIVQISANKT